MSVSLSPSSSLGFNRPFTVLVKRSLTITNHNGQAVAFKVKTTAPKLYCVRPNSGKIEPGQSVDVAVMLQPMKDEPPPSAKCKDKFLIQSTLVTAEKASLQLQDIWNTPEGGEEAKVYQQKLKVVYLPAEGETLEEEDETHANQGLVLNGGESQFGTVPQHPGGNGHFGPPIPEFPHDEKLVDLAASQDIERPSTPPADFNLAREESHEEQHGGISVVNVNVHTPPSPSPPLAPVESDPQLDADLLAKYNAAQAEIERLRTLLAAVPSSPPPTELRRRTHALSDDGSTVADTDVATMIDEGGLSQEGVPLQVVVIIALGVFITTYLFF